ncbi:MAG: peroxiredoxin [Verrucomicrobia bacterium]|nr:peroxiredoxin [Verrucomicrobiota bacterium]
MKHLPIILMSLFSAIFSHAGEGERVKPYPAPQVEAVDQDGKTVKLEDYYKKGFTLVYFYPKADTPGCTKQACSLRDSYEELTKAGVQVIGVSMDKTQSQKKFQEKYKLPFTLLADPDGKVIEAFGVGSFLGFASRQAYLIKDGQIIWRDKKASTSEQAADVLKVLKEMK